MSEKETLRRQFLQRRNTLDLDFVDSKSERVSRFILGSPLFQEKKLLAFYVAKEKEVSLRLAFSMALLAGKEVYLPKTWVQERKLTFHRIYTLAELKPGPFGLLEPQKGEMISVEDLEVIFVPGLAFDHRGFRLGYGGGFYDVALKPSRAIKVGVCFSFQLVERLPEEIYDVPMDFILTEEGWLQCVRT